MKILGIHFTNNNENITQKNFAPKIVQINREIEQWKRMHLTLMGKITVIKSLPISKIVHLFSALPSPSKKRDEITGTCVVFLFMGK